MKSRRVAPRRRTRLRGRAAECAVLDSLLADIRRSESRSLVLRGEAGIGKTALLEYLIASASDETVLRAAGVEAEMELSYASLQQLCAPLLEHLNGLPPPQRQALEIVFGLRPGPAPDRFLVGLGVLSLFSEAAAERPLICVVDDAQWLDHASAQALAFVARRLMADAVAIVFAEREGGRELQHVPELEIRGLLNGDAGALLRAAVRSRLDERVRDRIIAETHGNPLALLELPRGMTSTQLAGGLGLPDAQGLTGRIEENFVRRLETLPDETRRLLLIAAAEPLGDPLLMWHAADRLGIGPAAGQAVEVGEFLSIEERVTFRQSLIRSAVYRSSSAEERREVHLALAQVSDREADPDRRAWHLATAATGPDDEVASELERSAGRAQARGGFAAAAAFLQRAVALSNEPGRRAERALAAAQAMLQAGVFDRAGRLLTTAEAGELDEFQSARAALLRGRIAFASGLASGAAPLLLNAARRLERFDPELARETYLDACGAALFAGGEGVDVLLEICRAARALGSSDPSRLVDLLLEGFAVLVTDGRVAAAPILRRAVEVFAGEEISRDEGSRWGWMATAATCALWDHDGWRAIYTSQIQLVRDAGALERLPLYLFGLGTLAAWSGDFAEALSVIGETDEVTAITGARALPYASLLLVALQGSEAEASALIAATIERAGQLRQGIAVITARWVAAILYNGLGRYPDAMAAAREASADPLGLYGSMWALPELVEACARCGELDLAAHALDRLAETTRPAGTDVGLGIEARSRALLRGDADAERLYQEAIERLGRTRLRPELARAHLLFGEWLRRESRRAEARVQLREAHALFVRIGMEAFAERAAKELLATGELVRKRTRETRDDLTAQERHIAQLAREGLSNPEIGARLFLSPRTVEWHLRKVFAKLGIRSRRDLAQALPGSEAEPALA